MFCDFYNSSQGTYCKRLRVLCPEHFKDSTVISDTEVKNICFKNDKMYVFLFILLFIVIFMYVKCL